MEDTEKIIVEMMTNVLSEDERENDNKPKEDCLADKETMDQDVDSEDCDTLNTSPEQPVTSAEMPETVDTRDDCTAKDSSKVADPKKVDSKTKSSEGPVYPTMDSIEEWISNCHAIKKCYHVQSAGIPVCPKPTLTILEQLNIIRENYPLKEIESKESGTAKASSNFSSISPPPGFEREDAEKNRLCTYKRLSPKAKCQGKEVTPATSPDGNFARKLKEESNRCLFGANAASFTPKRDSKEYFLAAESYAVYGEDFLDFSKDYPSLVGEGKKTTKIDTKSYVINEDSYNEYNKTTEKFSSISKKKITTSRNEATSSASSTPTSQSTLNVINSNASATSAGLFGNGLFPTPVFTTNQLTAAAVANSAATAATYYQLCNSLQPALRNGVNTTTAYNILLNNRLTSQMTATSAANALSPVLYNQNSMTSNLFSSNLANSGFAANNTTTTFSSPMITTTQYLASNINVSLAAQNASAAAAAYDRLFQAQLLHHQVLQIQTQQQAFVASCLLQQQQQPTQFAFQPNQYAAGLCNSFLNNGSGAGGTTGVSSNTTGGAGLGAVNPNSYLVSGSNIAFNVPSNSGNLGNQYVIVPFTK